MIKTLQSRGNPFQKKNSSGCGLCHDAVIMAAVNHAVLEEDRDHRHSLKFTVHHIPLLHFFLLTTVQPSSSSS